MTGGLAALGPVSASVETSIGSHSEANFSRVYDPDHDMTCSSGGPVYITNVLATLALNGSVTVTFDVQGGTNGVFYDIFASSALSNSLPHNQWTWVGQALTCNTYTFTNQPFGVAFYILELSSETFTVAYGLNTSNQCNVPTNLTNAVAVAGGGYFSLALLNNGKITAWGGNGYGETNLPSGLTNVVGIAAGYSHGVALLANGSVTNWGTYYDGSNYSCSVTNRAYAGAPPTSGVVAVAAGLGQDLALMTNGKCVAWGFTNIFGTGAAYGTMVPTNLNLTNVASIACGWGFNLALSSNGTITAWGNNDGGLGYNLTNVPSDLISNAAAVAAGGYNSLALRKNGTVEAWGEPNAVVTNVPAGLSNVVAVATGGNVGLALQANGNLVDWGFQSWTNIPAGVDGVKAISAGLEHSLVLESGILNPVIYSQPVNEYAPTGSNVTFSAFGQGVAGLSYQWQFNGVNLTGATNATLSLTNVSGSNNGNYQVIISSPFGSITSSVATFTLIVPPQINSIGPPAAGTNWIASYTILSVSATASEPGYPLSYQWKFNGTNIAGATSPFYTINPPVPTDEGAYTISVTNAAGGTNVTWNVRMALPGMVEAWGDDDYGECDRPVTLTNAIAIAVGEYQSVAVTETGAVVQWGQYSNGTNYYSVTNTNYVTLPPASNVVAVAAGLGQGLALLANGNVNAWGQNGAYGTEVPANVSNVQAVACGWQFDVALLTNGTVRAWGLNDPALEYTMTNVPVNLSNVTAIAAGALHTLALKSNGTVVGWGYSPDGETNVPSGLSNVVAIAAGESHNLALLTNGTVVAWGLNDYGQTNVPAGLSNVMAVAAGDHHSVALKNDGTLVEWGDNSSGQATVPAEGPTLVIDPPPSIGYITNPPIVVKRIAAGGDHTMAAILSSVLQYPINVSKDLLLIYNATNISFSSNVCAYYMAHRPMVSGANVLGVTCPTNEGITWVNYINNFSTPIVNWLSTNPTIRPQYVILFQDLPSRLTNAAGTGTVSVQFDMNAGFDSQFGYDTTNYFRTWTPLITSINMNGVGGTNDCIAYINKLASIASNNPPKTLLLSASKAGYGNTNWYFDGSNYTTFATQAALGVSNALLSPSVVYTTTNHITKGTNVAGYWSPGTDGGVSPEFNSFATNGQIIFNGSNWFIMATVDSFNGQRVTGGTGYQAGFLTWFAANAFEGTNYNSYNYSNTPVGAVTHVDEPGEDGQENTYIYYGGWASGTPFGILAWKAFHGNEDGAYSKCAAVGDPFVEK